MTRIALAGASYPYSISVRRGALHDWAYFLCVCAYLNHSGTNALIKIHVSTRHLIEEASCMTCQRSCTCLNASHSGTNTPFSKSVCGHNIEWDTNFFTRAIRLGTSRFDPAGYALGMHARLRLAEEAILSAEPPSLLPFRALRPLVALTPRLVGAARVRAHGALCEACSDPDPGLHPTAVCVDGPGAS